MEIVLSGTRKITSDSYGYQLCKFIKVVNQDTGKESGVWRAYKYFSTIKGVLKSVPEQMLKESNANGWKECKNVLERSYNCVSYALNYKGKV